MAEQRQGERNDDDSEHNHEERATNDRVDRTRERTKQRGTPKANEAEHDGCDSEKNH